MRTVLIFGIAGFVGSYLTKEFIDNGYSVFGSDVVKNPLLINKVEYKEVDLLNTEAVKELVVHVNPDIIINLAAISSVGLSWTIPQKVMDINVNGALNIMDAARCCTRVPKIMFIGSSEEYNVSDKPIDESVMLNANNPYGISKQAQERFAQLYRERYNMKIYYVRPFNHTGIGQKDTFVLPDFCKQIANIEKSGKPGIIHVGNLMAKRDFSNVKDIVKAYRMIIERDDCSKVYNIGSGVAYSIMEMLNYIISLSSQKIEIKVDENRVRKIDNPFICCNNSMIRREIGWKPEYTIFETLKEMFEYYLQA